MSACKSRGNSAVRMVAGAAAVSTAVLLCIIAANTVLERSRSPTLANLSAVRASLSGAAGLLAVAAVAPPAVVLGSCAAPSRERALVSFTAFYPKYLREHSKLSTKRMHYLGTAITLLMMLHTPALAGAMACAMAVGLALFPWLQWTHHGALEALAVVAVFAAATDGLPMVMRLGPAVAGYGCAWIGHFFMEKNRPATFIYPTFSLIGDFRMFAEAVLGLQPR